MMQSIAGSMRGEEACGYSCLLLPPGETKLYNNAETRFLVCQDIFCYVAHTPAIEHKPSVLAVLHTLLRTHLRQFFRQMNTVLILNTLHFILAIEHSALATHCTLFWLLNTVLLLHTALYSGY